MWLTTFLGDLSTQRRSLAYEYQRKVLGVGNPLKGLYKEGERYLLALSYLKPSGSHKQNIAKIKGQSRCTVIWVLNDRMYCNVITTDEHM